MTGSEWWGIIFEPGGRELKESIFFKPLVSSDRRFFTRFRMLEGEFLRCWGAEDFFRREYFRDFPGIW